MKILMATTYYYPHVSGLTLWFQYLSEELARRHHKVTVICSKHDPSLPRREIINGVKTIRTPIYFQLSKGVFLPQLLFDVWGELENADIIHLNLPSLEATYLAFVGKMLGKRVISTYVCDLTLPNFLGSHIFEKVVDWHHHITLNLSDAITTFTKDFAEHSRVLKNYLNRIKAMYPPVILPELQTENNIPIQARFNLTTNKPVIGMICRFAAEKGIGYLLETIPSLAKKFPKLRIAFAGEPQPLGEDKYRKKLIPLFKKYRKHLIFLGVLSQTEVRSFYETIDLLIIASTNSTEAFGLVQVEAMLCGTPVVATDLPGVREPVYATGMGEIVPTRNSRALAQAIMHILENRTRHMRSQAEIKQIFNFEQAIAFYENLYCS